MWNPFSYWHAPSLKVTGTNRPNGYVSRPIFYSLGSTRLKSWAYFQLAWASVNSHIFTSATLRGITALEKSAVIQNPSLFSACFLLFMTRPASGPLGSKSVIASRRRVVQLQVCSSVLPMCAVWSVYPCVCGSNLSPVTEMFLPRWLQAGCMWPRTVVSAIRQSRRQN